MSQLTEILNLIESWVQEYNADAIRWVKMRPGLTIGQIEKKLEGLPYKLPRDFFELYQWHDGGQPSFLPFPDSYEQNFFDLNEAISIAIDWNRSGFPNMNAFPLFSVEDVIYWTLGSEKQQNAEPIYSSDEGEFPSSPNALSLTAFLENEIERLRFE